MTTVITLGIILVFLFILYSFYYMQKKHIKFSTRVFISLFLGIIFGGILQLLFGTKDQVITQSMEWIGIVGNGYVAFLQMLDLPHLNEISVFLLKFIALEVNFLVFSMTDCKRKLMN